MPKKKQRALKRNPHQVSISPETSPPPLEEKSSSLSSGSVRVMGSVLKGVIAVSSFVATSAETELNPSSIDVSHSEDGAQTSINLPRIAVFITSSILALLGSVWYCQSQTGNRPVPSPPETKLTRKKAKEDLRLAKLKGTVQALEKSADAKIASRATRLRGAFEEILRALKQGDQVITQLMEIRSGLDSRANNYPLMEEEERSEILAQISDKVLSQKRQNLAKEAVDLAREINKLEQSAAQHTRNFERTTKTYKEAKSRFSTLLNDIAVLQVGDNEGISEDLMQLTEELQHNRQTEENCDSLMEEWQEKLISNPYAVDSGSEEYKDFSQATKGFEQSISRLAVQISVFSQIVTHRRSCKNLLRQLNEASLLELGDEKYSSTQDIFTAGNSIIRQLEAEISRRESSPGKISRNNSHKRVSEIHKAKEILKELNVQSQKIGALYSEIQKSAVVTTIQVTEIAESISTAQAQTKHLIAQAKSFLPSSSSNSQQNSFARFGSSSSSVVCSSSFYPPLKSEAKLSNPSKPSKVVEPDNPTESNSGNKY